MNLINQCEKLKTLLNKWLDENYYPLLKKYENEQSERLRYRNMAISYKKEKDELERIIKSLNNQITQMRKELIKTRFLLRKEREK